MKKLRWVFLGLSMFCALISMLWLAFDMWLLVPRLNMAALAGVPVCLLLFFIMSLRKRGQKQKNAVVAVLAVLCCFALVWCMIIASFKLFFVVSGTVYTSPQGRKMFVQDTSFHDTSFQISPVHWGCFYLKNRRMGSEGVIETIRWPDDHTAEVYIFDHWTNNAWWRYDFITKEWSVAEP